MGNAKQIWFLDAAHQLGPHVKPAGNYGGCFLARCSHVTGDIQVHEMAWGASEELWLVSTLFSSLCTLNPNYDFIPRWRPPFISNLVADHHCHFKGLALENGQPRHVTALAETDEPVGWRVNKATSGCLIDVPRALR